MPPPLDRGMPVAPWICGLGAGLGFRGGAQEWGGLPRLDGRGSWFGGRIGD